MTLIYYHASGPALLIQSLDSDIVRDQCLALDLDPDWWYSKANHVTIRAGRDPNEAYLLLRYGDFPNVEADDSVSNNMDNWRTSSLGIIRLDQGSQVLLPSETGANPGTTEIAGWIFHSAEAVIPSEDYHDQDSIYLVKFVDKRWKWAISPQSASVGGQPSNYNALSPISGTIASDPTDVTAWPYDLDTTPSSTGPPFTWAEVLSAYWSSFTGDTFPATGTYPEFAPMDIRPENRTHYETFIETLHSVAHEIYPLLDGTFTLLPIDDEFDAVSSLTDYQKFLIDSEHPQREYERLPNYARIFFRTYYHDSSFEKPSRFYLSGRLDITGWDFGAVDVIFWDDVEESFSSVASVAVFVAGPTYAINDGLGTGILTQFAEVVLKRLFRARILGSVQSTYGRFIALPPSPEFQEVEFAVHGGRVTTTFRTIQPSIGPSFIPETDSVGSGGSGTDRLVAADSTDDTPQTLHQKLNDHGTYDAGLHQIVFASVVMSGTDPTQDNHVRLFVVASDVEGPPGAAGADGDTVTEGYSIDVAHAGTVATVSFDPTEITGFAATFQMFQHLAAETGQTQPKWLSFSNYVGGADQLWWHRGGVFQFHTITLYDAAANQLIFNQADLWKFKTTDNYINSVGTKQLLGHDGDQWVWKTVAEWLNTLPDFDAAASQDVGHLAGGATKWQVNNDPIIVKVTGTISGRSGTTRGTGSAQPVHANLTNNGGAISVYNFSQLPFVGTADSPRYSMASKIEGDYFLANFDLNSVVDFDLTKDQELAHPASGDTHWQDLLSITLNNPTDIELNIGSGALTSVLDYTPYVTCRLWAVANAPSTFDDSVSVTNCATS